MPNKVMVRPDGSTVTVPDTDAEKFATLGYSEQKPEAELEQAISVGQEAYYSTPYQKFLTFAEGGDSGVSLGLTDMLFGTEESRERARANPGTRIAAEIGGNLAATMVPGVGILRFTPAGAVTNLGVKAGAAAGKGSKVIGGMVRGGVEGAGIGAGQAITTAQLDGSPVTAEAILAGMGQGALWGGGLGALGGGIEAKLESRAAKKAASEADEALEVTQELSKAEREYKAVQGLADDSVTQAVKQGKMETEHFERMAASIQDAASQIKEIDRSVAAAMDVDFNKLGTMNNKAYSKLADSGNLHYVRPESRNSIKHFSLAQAAAKEGKHEKMITHLEKFKDEMVSMQAKLGGPKIHDTSAAIQEANNLIGIAKHRVDTATNAVTELAEMNAVQSTLKAFPKTLEEFHGMTSARLEKLTAGVDALQGLKAAELGGLKEAVKNAVSEMSAGMGVKLEGTPGAQLQALWKITKEGGSARVQEMLERGKQGNLLWDKYSKAKGKLDDFKKEEKKLKGMSPAQRAMLRSAQYGAGVWTANKLGIGYGGYVLGSSLVAGLVGLKGAILGTLSDKAAKYLPHAAKGAQKYGSRLEPLATRLDGVMEDKEKDRAKLMETRIREISEAAPAIRDTMYRAVQPLSIEHPELAAALHTLGIKRFQFLMSKMPKDPGLAYSKLKSLWKPDKIEVEKFSRYYEAYHDPVGVLTRALEQTKITPEAAEAIQEMNPELWTHFRSALLFRISDPEVLKDMSYQDQVQLGFLTGITFHASMDPRFIASTQQMFLERNQPLEMNPQTQPGGGAGRPAANSPRATTAQRNTEH